MNKCFTCEYLQENKEQHQFTCSANCMDCKHWGKNWNEDPCNNCNFNNECVFEKVEE